MVRWFHPNRNDCYYQSSKNILGFFLTLVGSNISSVISYDSEESAIKDGWKSNE
jgi:hypothetical protein